jgi:hypothetical protein
MDRDLIAGILQVPISILGLDSLRFRLSGRILKERPPADETQGAAWRSMTP